MNRIQHKKWIDTLGIGLFILTLLYMCGLTSNKDEIEIEQNVVTEDKIQQETDNDLPADFPKDLFFNSGVGGWRTYLRLNRDGSFTGEYSDFNAYAEDDFPKGTVTICEFEGKFTNIQRMDQYHYTMSLENGGVVPFGQVKAFAPFLLSVGAMKEHFFSFLFSWNTKGKYCCSIYLHGFRARQSLRPKGVLSKGLSRTAAAGRGRTSHLLS